MNECQCGRPTRDTFTVCETCLDGLARSLGDVPWLIEELEVTVSRQQGVDYRRLGGSSGGKKPAEMPTPGNMGAAEARTHLKALLVSWTMLCHEEGVRHQSMSADLPADDAVALSRWLLWRVDGLGMHDAGHDAVDEIVSAVAHCHRVIDIPTDQQYLGDCDQCSEGRLYASPTARWARCRKCEAVSDAEELRAALLSRLDDRLCTAAEIARLSTYLGLRLDREQVRKRINQWAKRGLLAEAASFSDEPTFRFGAVYERLMADEYRRVG